jgi:LPS-assembly protein
MRFPYPYLILWLLLTGSVTPLMAEQAGDEQALLSANQVTYDQQRKIMTAEGAVEIERDGRILLADRVTYVEDTRMMTADGHVKLTEPTGEVLFADSLELDDRFRDGFAEQLRLLLPDNSRMTAQSGDRKDGEISTMNIVTFSPCKPCQNPDKAPFWQLRADRLTHQQSAKEIVYHNAWLEFSGIPVFYTPYFSYPDPSVKKKSGLLAPSYIRSGQNGNGISAAYFWDIAPDKDLTLQPVSYDLAGNLLRTDYRQRFAHGEVDVQASGGLVDQVLDSGVTERTGRGHVKAEGRYDLNQNWRLGANLQKASDRAYMSRYEIDKNLQLQNRLYGEGFYGRDYANISALTFDDLRLSVDPEISPRALPVASYEYYSAPFGGTGWWRDSYLRLTPSTAILQRNRALNSQRLSNKAEWVMPEQIGLDGTRLSLNGLLQTDLYKIQQPQTNNTSETAMRAVPMGTIKIDRPLVAYSGTFRQTLNPLVQVHLTPNAKQSSRIPDEDSQSFELDESNLLSTNRFPGIDRQSTGNRLDYGLGYEVTNHEGQKIRSFVGQSLQPNAAAVYTRDTGAGQKVSDVVGGVAVGLSPNTEVTYRFRRDHQDLTSRRNEIGFNTVVKPFDFSASYVKLAPQSATADSATSIVPQEQAQGSIGVNFLSGWRFTANSARDLGTGSTRNFGGALTYGNECSNISANFVHDFTTNSVDKQPGTTLLLQINLKYLGDIGSESLSF